MTQRFLAIELRLQDADAESRRFSRKLDHRFFGRERVAEHVRDSEHALIAGRRRLNVHVTLEVDHDRAHSGVREIDVLSEPAYRLHHVSLAEGYGLHFRREAV